MIQIATQIPISKHPKLETNGAFGARQNAVNEHQQRHKKDYRTDVSVSFEFPSSHAYTCH